MKKSHSNYKTPSPFLVKTMRYFSLFVSKIIWRIEYKQTENIPQNLRSGLLITPNHQTYFDPFWVCIPIKRDLRFMAWDAAFEWFLLGNLISSLGAFPVSLKRVGKIKAIKESIKFLNEGKTLLIFPEGEREYSDGKLLTFKNGAVRMALQTNVPILPVTIRGGNKVWARDHKFPRPRKVQIIYHPIIETKNLKTSQEINLMTEKITNDIKNLIGSKLN